MRKTTCKNLVLKHAVCNLLAVEVSVAIFTMSEYLNIYFYYLCLYAYQSPDFALIKSKSKDILYQGNVTFRAPYVIFIFLYPINDDSVEA